MIKKSLLLGGLGSALLTLPAFSAEQVLITKIDTVTVYPGGASISELGDVSLPDGATTLVVENFPDYVDIDTLRAAGSFSGAVTVRSINSRENDEERSTPEIDGLNKQLEDLQQERGALDDALRSSQAQLRLVEEFARQAPRGFTEALAKGADALSEWQTALDAIQSGQMSARNDIRRLTKSIGEIDEKSSKLETRISELEDKLSPTAVLINVSSQGAVTGSLSLSYQTSQAGWNAGYDAFLTTQGKDGATLDLVQLASVSQSTGADWNNVKLTLSTTQPARGTTAPLLSTLQVYEQSAERTPVGGYLSAPSPEPARAQLKLDVSGNMMVQSRIMSETVDQLSITAENGSFEANFAIPERVNISGDGSARRLTIAKHQVSPELLAVAVPSIQEIAFLHAQIKNETGAPLLGGTMSVHRDGTYIGRTHFNFMPLGEERSLGFGPDDKVAISYITEDRQVAEQGIISSEKTDTRRYVTKVTNNHNDTIRIRVVDRQPFTEDDTIRVERLATSTDPSDENVNDHRGILAWSFEYEPGESREINFDYRVTWPADKSVSFGSPALR